MWIFFEYRFQSDIYSCGKLWKGFPSSLHLSPLQVGEGLSQNKLVFCQPYCQIKTFLYACETESHNFQTLITFTGGSECIHTHYTLRSWQLSKNA